jgi:hypothetical protein
MAEKVFMLFSLTFSKAFDMVDQRILLSKLASMNLTKSFWLWIRDFPSFLKFFLLNIFMRLPQELYKLI